MKNTFKVWGTIAMLAVLVFTFTACGTDDNSGGGGVTYEPVVYKSVQGATAYELTITKGAAKAAVTFTPANGDSYRLTITTAGVTKTSSGTITVTASGFIMNHASGQFTVTITKEVMTSITGEIPLDNSADKVQPPGAVNINLVGTTWIGTVDYTNSAGVKFKGTSTLTFGATTVTEKIVQELPEPRSAESTQPYTVSGNTVTVDGMSIEITGNKFVLVGGDVDMTFIRQ